MTKEKSTNLSQLQMRIDQDLSNLLSGIKSKEIAPNHLLNSLCEIVRLNGELSKADLAPCFVEIAIGIGRIQPLPRIKDLEESSNILSSYTPLSGYYGHTQ